MRLGKRWVVGDSNNEERRFGRVGKIKLGCTGHC